MMKDEPDDFFIAPDYLAETAFHLTVQPRSAWSFEVEARPYKEPCRAGSAGLRRPCDR